MKGFMFHIQVIINSMLQTKITWEVIMGATLVPQAAALHWILSVLNKEITLEMSAAAEEFKLDDYDNDDSESIDHCNQTMDCDIQSVDATQKPGQWMVYGMMLQGI